MSLSFDQIYTVVKMVPRGSVATYGQIAALAGDRRGARTVGWALHSNPDSKSIPCYRVVSKEGRVSPAFVFGGENMQISLLEKDGIPCDDGIVDLEKFLWRPDEAEIYEIVGNLENLSSKAAGS